MASLLFTGAVSDAQQSVHTPQPGSPEREAIMDIMRLDFCRKGTHSDAAAAHRNPGVFFKVYFLKVHGDWALTCVLPVGAAGKIIAEPRWGLLLRKSGRWVDVDYLKALDPYLSIQKEADDALAMTLSIPETEGKTVLHFATPENWQSCNLHDLIAVEAVRVKS